MRIGILGGTFDPIHNGHLILCEKICENFSLDKIYFIPCHEPPHKKRRDIAHPFHRLSMVVLGTAANPKFYPSSYEIEKGNRSYTIETLTYFQKAVGDEGEILFIVGLDSLFEIETWKDYEKILEGWNLIVINRSGYIISEARKRFPKWIAEKIEIVPGVMPSTPQANLKRIFFARVEPVNISSSTIREKVRKGEGIQGLVPETVEQYIKKFDLYRRES